MSHRGRAGIRSALQAFLRPVPLTDGLAPGAFYSALEMLAERKGLDLVERFFEESRLARAVARVYARYVGDPEAERALRKGYHVTYDERLRVLALRQDPPPIESGLMVVPERTHPIDGYVARDLYRIAGSVEPPGGDRQSFSATIRHWVSAATAGVRFLCEATLLLLKHGVSRTVPTGCRVASPNFWPEDRWVRLRRAFEDLGTSSPSDLCIVMERSDKQELRHGKFLTVDPMTFQVPRWAWLRRVYLPGIRLFLELFLLSFAAVRDARCLELVAECFRQASYSLLVWRIAFNVSFESYLDNVEYLPQHNVKAIIFRKFGGKLVRIPHSQMDTPGAAFSYLGHDVFLSGGDYQRATYGRSWSPATRSVSVGQIQNDRRVAARQRVTGDAARRIGEFLQEGRRLAVFFGSSLRAGRFQVLDALAALRLGLSGLDDWFVVMKPKGTHQDFYRWMEEDVRLQGWLDDTRVIAVRYDGSGTEVCPAGWLIGQMAFGVCMGGSVQIESLTRGVPVFAFRRIWQDTPYTQALVDFGLLHSEPASLAKALRQRAIDPTAFAIPYDWFRKRFDPFTDDQALLRMASVLLGREERAWG